MGEVAFVGYDEGVEFCGRFSLEICGFAEDGREWIPAKRMWQSIMLSIRALLFGFRC